MTPTEKILDKLAKMKAMRESEEKIGNQEAADAFASAINRLLLQHELSEVDIPNRADVAEEPIVEHLVEPRLHGIKFSRSRVGWQEALATIVADAHLCKILVTSGTNYVTFVGTKQHCAVAEYAYVVLVNAAVKMSKEARDAYWRENRHRPDFESGNFRAAWLRGFIQRIGERFREERRREVQATSNPGTAMVHLSKALVRAESYIADKYKKKAPPTSIGRGCDKGHRAGKAAADAMNIGQRGVAGVGGAKALLKGGK